jgi:hypothetical protein
MPITKDGNGKLVYTAPLDEDLAAETGVYARSGFAVSDDIDKLKQIKFDPSAQQSNSSVTIKSGATSGDVIITLPATSSSIGSGNCFKTIQTPAGTYPVATGSADVLTITNTDSFITITGDSSTDTIDFKIATSTATDQDVISVNSSGSPVWRGDNYPGSQFVFCEDFVGNPFDIAAFNFGNSGAGSTGNGNGTTQSVAGVRGVIRCSTGTTTTGLGGFYGYQAMFHSDGTSTYETKIKLSQLSDGTDTYTVYIGLGDQGGNSTEHNYGVYFMYTSGVSANWVVKNAKAGTRTSMTTSTAVTTSWTKLKFVVNAAGTSTEFFVNGSSVGSISSNIPSDYNFTPSFNTKIVKSAGTTSCHLDTDYLWYRQLFTSGR